MEVEIVECSAWLK